MFRNTYRFPDGEGMRGEGGGAGRRTEISSTRARAEKFQRGFVYFYLEIIAVGPFRR